VTEPTRALWRNVATAVRVLEIPINMEYETPTQSSENEINFTGNVIPYVARVLVHEIESRHQLRVRLDGRSQHADHRAAMIE